MPRSRPTWHVRLRACIGASTILLALAAAAPAGAPAMPWAGPGVVGGGADAYVDALARTSPAVQLVVSAPSVEVSEAGNAANLTVRLASAPDRIVSVTLLADEPAAAPHKQVRATSSSALEFGPDTWSEPRPITISAINDDIAEASPHVASVTLAAVDGDGLLLDSTTVDVSITDNDVPKVIVQPAAGGTVAVEGGASGVLDVRLATRPLADVTVQLQAGDQLVASAPDLTFTRDDWATMQAIRIGALQDHDVEGEHSDAVAFSLRSEDPAYARGGAVPDAHGVRVLDDDAPGIYITPSGVDTRVWEGGAGDEYVVKLLARPTSTVRVQVVAGEDLVVSPTALVFAPDAWQSPQQVTVTAVDDDIDEPGVENVPIRHVLDGDEHWRGIPAPGVPVAVTDDDDPVPATDDGDYAGDDGSTDGAVSDEGRAGRRAISGALTGGDPMADSSGGSARAPRGARLAAKSAGGFDLSKLRAALALQPVRPAAVAPRAAPAQLVADATAARVQASAETGAESVPAGGSWRPRNSKLALATAIGALALGGTIFALMSDPSQVGRRRLW